MNKIISNISIGILIFISIFNGFSTNHIQVPYPGTGVTSLTPLAIIREHAVKKAG